MALPQASSPARSQLIRDLGRSPAFRFLAAVWILCALWLLAAGRTVDLVPALIALAGVAVFGGLTVLLTPAGPPALPEPPATRRTLWVQTAMLIVVFLLTLASGFAFHRSGPVWLHHIPVWSDFTDWIGRLGAPLGNPNFTKNPTEYFVVPFLFLLLLGARPGELGLRRAYRWLPVTLVCAAPYLIALPFKLVGGWPVLALGRSLFSNFMQNGFFEEFLFRGALQTRLTRLIGSDWGIVLSSVLFGVWHLGTMMDYAGGNPVTAAALTILYQGMAGVAFAIIFRRTGSLLAPSLIHLLVNALGI